MSKQKYPQASSKTSTDGSTVKKGREHYSHAKADARIDKRRHEADARQLKYDDLHPEQKIKLAKSRRGESKREIARITKLMSAEKAPAVKVAPMTEPQKAVKAVKRAKSAAASVK